MNISSPINPIIEVFNKPQNAKGMREKEIKPLIHDELINKIKKLNNTWSKQERQEICTAANTTSNALSTALLRNTLFSSNTLIKILSLENISFQKFVFDNKPDLLLPKMCSMLIQSLSAINNVNTHFFADLINELLNLKKQHCSTSFQGFGKIMYYRLLDYCIDNAISPKDLFQGESTQLRRKVREWIDSEEVEETTRIERIIYIALILEVPIDYLLMSDYTKSCNSYILSQNNTKIYLDTNATNIVSIFLDLPREIQFEFLAKVKASNIRCEKERG